MGGSNTWEEGTPERRTFHCRMAMDGSGLVGVGRRRGARELLVAGARRGPWLPPAGRVSSFRITILDHKTGYIPRIMTLSTFLG